MSLLQGSVLLCIFHKRRVYTITVGQYANLSPIIAMKRSKSRTNLQALQEKTVSSLPLADVYTCKEVHACAR